MGPIDTSLVAECPLGPERFHPDSARVSTTTHPTRWRARLAGPALSAGRTVELLSPGSWSWCFRLMLIWEQAPGPGGDARDRVGPGQVIPSRRGARRGPMPPIQGLDGVWLQPCSLLCSRILGCPAVKAGTPAAESDRHGGCGPGERRGGEQQEAVIAGMGSSAQPRLG